MDEYNELSWYQRGTSWRLLAILGTFGFIVNLLNVVIIALNAGELSADGLASSRPGLGFFVIPVGLACIAGPIYHKPRELEPWPAWNRLFFIAMSLFVLMQWVLWFMVNES